MNIYNAISSNKWKTWIIMILFVAFITTFIYIISKALGLNVIGMAGIALVLSGVMSIGSYFYSDKLVLKTAGAKQITKNDYPKLYLTVENLSIAAGLPMPKVYVVQDKSPNAFATGRDPKHAVVATTTGLLDMMNDAELEGIIAHELSHVKNYDIRLAGILAVLVGFVVIMSDIFLRVSIFRSIGGDRGGGNAPMIIIALVLAILSPIAASLIQLSVSRKRELLADASGALLTRYPEGLASALEKLAHDHTPPKTASNATAHMYIENPFDNKKVKNQFTGLFNTHPPLQERIKVLRNM